MSDQQPQEEQRAPSVTEVLLSSVHLMVTLGVQAIAARDMDGARLAIDSISAMVPLLERVLPADAVSQYRQALADMQLAFAGAQTTAPPPPPAGAQEPLVQTPPRPKIWTPEGDV